MSTLVFYLLELEQEGTLVLAAAVLLHPLLDELVEDGGDGLGAHPLQQLQFGAKTTHVQHVMYVTYNKHTLYQ